MENEAARVPSRYRRESKKSLFERLNISLFLSDFEKERKERGAREFRRVRKSDAVLFSPGNSGRTWLRVMLTRLIEIHYGLAGLPPINFNNLNKIDDRVLKLMVTHNRWLPYYKTPRKGRECKPYYGSRVVMLVRNPLDTCISQYFQWKHRSSDKNIHLKEWPDRTSSLTLEEFLHDDRTGVLRLCQELNIWGKESCKFKHSHMVRYEDLRRSPEQELGRIAQFVGIDASKEALTAAVEYARFENMQNREAGQSHSSEDRHNYRVSVGANNGLKARQGLIAGYAKYLGADKCRQYENMISQNLDGCFGYANLPEISPFQASSD
jgi:hypothetical protein